MPREDVRSGVLQGGVRERAEVRLMLNEWLPCVRVRGDRADLDIGVACEQAQNLATCIAGCAGDGDGVRHSSTLTVSGSGSRGWATAEAATPALRCPTGQECKGRLETAAAQADAASGHHAAARSERRASGRGRR